MSCTTEIDSITEIKRMAVIFDPKLYDYLQIPQRLCRSRGRPRPSTSMLAGNAMGNNRQAISNQGFLERGRFINAAKVDTVKQRMEAAYETLQDAAGLTQLSSTVEDVFASGDLPHAAETLAKMRHCLSAVGEVAEFANVRKQLEVLEDRLDLMVQPRLTDALSNRKVTCYFQHAL
ncbi:Conserved oligomeric Golgi complex subunit 7 [Linum grandiflorum]